MATTNQRKGSGGNRGQAKHSNGRKAASRASNLMEDARDQITECVSQGTERFGQMTRGHEGQAAMIALAAGFGIGLVIGCSLASGGRRSRSWTDRLTAEGIGRKFMERVESVLPEMVSERLHR